MTLSVYSLNKIDQQSHLLGVTILSALLLLTSVTVIFPAMAENTVAVELAAGQKPMDELIAECKQLEDQDPAAAITLAKQLLSQLSSPEDELSYGHALGCMGWAYVTQNELTAARAKALDLEQLVAELDGASIDSVQLARRAGGIFHRMGDRISASENYSKAMQQAETLGVVSEQIPILVNLGVLNSELREHEQAIDNYYQALDLMQATDDFRYQPPVLYNLAATLNGQKRFIEGLKVFQQVEAMVTEQWPPGRIAQTYQGLAAAYSALNNLPMAKDYAEQALQILSDNDQLNSGYFNVMSVLANIYARQGGTQLATSYANQATQFYLDPENRPDVLGSTNPLSNLALTYERLGLLKQAIKVHKASKSIEQKIQDTFNQEVMAQMQVRLNNSQQREAHALLNSERIKNQIQLKEAEHKRRTWLLLTVAGIVVFLMFLLWQQLAHRKLKQMAMTDTLTRLGNRRAAKAWLATHKVPKEPDYRLLWLIDLDKFKAVNDEYDHDVGDVTLQKIAEALAKLSNNRRFLGRWGGEEFIFITDDVTENEKDGFSQLLLNTVKHTHVKTGAASLNLTASVGVSRVVDQSRSAWTKAMHQSDKALYSAKRRGRDCVVIATINT